MSTPHIEITEEMVDAAVNTSSRQHLRDSDAKARYRVRVREVLEAAAPLIHRQAKKEVRERLLAVAHEIQDRGYAADGPETTRLLFAEATAIVEVTETVLPKADGE